MMTTGMGITLGFVAMQALCYTASQKAFQIMTKKCRWNLMRMISKIIERRLMLTGQHIHQAYATVFPANAFAWDDVSEVARRTYEAVANELNKMLEAQQVTI